MDLIKYYPIKCVYCGQVMNNGTVVYKLAEEEVEKSGRELLREDFSDSLTMDNQAVGMDSGSFGDIVGPEQRTVYATYRELAEIVKSDSEGSKCTCIVDGNIDMVEKKDAILEEIERYGLPVETFRGRLITGLELENFPINNKRYSGIIKKRRCCNCHKLLSQYAGKMPTYTVGLLGHSSAGKTVYFTILHKWFQQQYFFQGGVVSSSPDLSFLDPGMDSEFDGFLSDLLNKRQLPSTTMTAIKQPYCRMFTYTQEGCPSYTTRCLLSIRDVQGELFTKGATKSQDNERAIIELCNNANGLLMVVDPMALDRPRTCLPDNQRGNQTTDTFPLIAMEDFVFQELEPKGEQVQKPTVVMLSKEDLLLSNAKSLKIDCAEPVVATGQACKFDKNWFSSFLKPVNESTKALINYLDPAFASFLSRKFGNAVNIPVSALGNKVQTQKERTSDNGGTITLVMGPEILPRFAEAPIFYLLMRFGVLPPIQDKNYATDVSIYENWYRDFVQHKEPKIEPEEEQEVSNVETDTESQSKWSFFKQHRLFKRRE